MPTYSPFIDPSTRPVDLEPDNYADVGGDVQSQQVITTYDIYAPNELIQVFERHDHQPGLRLMLKAMGFSRGTFKPTVGHWEYTWRENLFHLGSVVTPAVGAGDSATVAISADAMYDASQTANGSAVKASYPIVGEIIYLPDGTAARIESKDTTTDPHQFVITPIQATMDISSNLIVDEKYSMPTNAWGESTGLPTGRTPRVVKYQNDFQIIKEVAGVSGSELTNKAYFNPLPGRPGSFYLKTEQDMLWRFEGKCNGALLLGQLSDNITEFSSELGIDVPVNTTEGVYHFVEDNGNTEIYTPGSMALDDFDAVSATFETERIGTRYVVGWMGYSVYNEIENLILESLNNDTAALLTKDLLNYDEGVMPYDGFQPREPQDFAMKIAFRALQKGRFTYGFKMLHEFNYAKGVGSSDYDFTQRAIFTPIGFTKDPIEGGRGCFIGYEFKALDGYSRETVPAQIVGAGANATYQVLVSDQFDRRKTAMVSEISFHGACPNQCVIMKP